MPLFDRDRWRAVSPYLDRALEMGEGELAEWLASLRAEQPVLAADLDMLLAERRAIDREGFLAQDADHSAPKATPEPPERTLGSIGPYRLIRLLGEGGMGIVYLAEQTEPIRREVALKVIKAGMDTKQVIARFEAERQALAMMDHPCVSKVLDAGSTPEGRPYFVMECVAGVPITEHCDKQTLTTRQRLDLFLQLCEGVQHSHQKAIIHRDLKPSNVLVSLQDGVAVPRIIDFGVAKATAQRLTEKTLLTEAGMLIGTPDYMSPEQADLSLHDVDTRTDVYALGVILYELLVGALPFEPRALREAGFDGIRRMIREVEPPRPSTRLGTLGGDRSAESARHRRVDLSTLRRQLAGELDWITMKALEKDRARRYGSPEELAADIRRYLRNEPVVAGPPGAAYRTRKFVRRHRIGVVAAGAAILAPVAFAVAMAVQAGRIAREAESKNRMSEFLTGLFEVSDPSEARGNSITARELLDKGAAKIRGTLAVDPLGRADLMETMGTVYRNLGLHSQAEPLLKEALETRRQVQGREAPDTLRLANETARLYFAQGRYKESEALHRETLDIQKRVLGTDHPSTLDSMNSLANVEWAQGRYKESEGLAREALEIQKRALGLENPTALRSMDILATAYRGQGRYKEAEALHRETLDIQKRVLGADHPSTLTSMTYLAWTYQALGRYKEAEALYSETLSAQRRVFGTEHPVTLLTMTHLGNAYLDEGRHKEAEALQRETLDIKKRVLGPEHADTLASMTYLARVYSLTGRSGDAEVLYREILDTQRRILGPEHSSTLWSMNNLAVTYDKQGRYKDAEALHRKTLEVRARVLGPEHPDTLNSMSNLSQVLKNLGRYEEAAALARQTLETRRRVLGPEHPKTVMSIYTLGDMAALAGDRQQALLYLREAVEHGFSDAKAILGDTDLRSLKNDPELERIVADARANGERAARAP